MSRRGWVVLLLAVAATVLLVSLRSLRVAEKASQPLLKVAPPVVEAAAVVQESVARRLALQGTVVAATSADLAARITAPVVARTVEPGDRVRAGQLLLRLDDERLLADVRRLESDLAAASADLRGATERWRDQQRVTARDRILAEAGAISTESLERSEMMESTAEASVAAATARRDAIEQAVAASRARLEDASLTAPWAGEVVEVSVSAGDLAIAGRPCVRLVRDGAHRVWARVPQDSTTALQVGTPATLRHGLGAIAAEVSRVAAGLDPGGLVAVEIDLDRAPFGLRDGAFLEVVFELESVAGLAVPLRSLLSGARGTFVFVIEGESEVPSVRVRAVEVLLRGEQMAAVRGQLAAGDRVAVGHPSLLMMLAEGQAVRLATPRPGGGP